MFYAPKNAEVKITGRREINRKTTEKYTYIEEIIEYAVTKYFVEFWQNNHHCHLCKVFYTEAEALEYFNRNHEYGAVLDKIVKEISPEHEIVKHRKKNMVGC